ncbi:hypothetical protein D6C78_06246 [Aureobasidium pullulans]|uniref:Uncharacterized protein n=1 Tax=Aureobasidium pullulans TaxID=5580 RepID=A0A4T0BLS3_AURPU|nr:hypothetical protein D6C78_06246 [Aureobasidium pullulans]
MTVNLADLESYDHRRSQADSRSQSMVWGSAQPMYSQYPWSAPYPMFDQYSCFSGLYPQPQQSLQETLFNQPYQLPLYSWQTSIQDGLTGPFHGTDFEMEPRTDILSSPTMLRVQSQVEGQALGSSDSAGSSGSPQQLQLMPAGYTRTASPAGTGTAEDLINYVCDTLWRPKGYGGRTLPTSSFEIKSGSIDVSVRFVVESSQNQDANQETDRVFQSEELAQQPLKQVLKILSSCASRIPGEHEICISSDATSTKIRTKHHGLN